MLSFVDMVKYMVDRFQVNFVSFLDENLMTMDQYSRRTWMDGICDLYRGFRAGDRQVISLSVVVLDGNGHAGVLTWDGAEVRRVTVTDELVALGRAVAGLKNERSEERVC